MPEGRHIQKTTPAGPLDLSGLVGASVEVRTVGGGAHRGAVLAVGPEWIGIERRTGGRLLARIEHVTSIEVEDFKVRGQE